MNIRMERRLTDAHPMRSAARYYGFRRTAEAIGDVPLTAEAVARCLREIYGQQTAALLYDDSLSPWLAVFRG